MAQNPFCKAYWKDVDPDRMAAHREGYGWHAITQRHFAPAEISPNRAFADFGCVPGKIAVELPWQVGPSGHVHAFDINVEFIEITRKIARAMGFVNRLTTNVSDGKALLEADAQ